MKRLGRLAGRHAATLRSPWIWLSLASFVLLVVFLIWPVGNILVSSFTAQTASGQSGWQVLLSEPRYPRAIGNTVMLGLGVMACSVLIGVPLAYFTARYNYPGKWLVSILPLITLVIPEVISVQTWLMLLGNNGIIRHALDNAFGINLPSFYGWPGLLTVMTFTYYAYVYIGTLAAMRAASSSSGHRPSARPQSMACWPRNTRASAMRASTSLADTPRKRATSSTKRL